MDIEKSIAKILLVEDNEINREVAIDLLDPLNLSIDIAKDGEEAVSKICQYDYDLVFMDYLMPVMDGAKATGFIRELKEDKYINLPIIALTASADEISFMKSSGMNDVIIKPITLENAKDILVSYLPNIAVEIIERYQNNRNPEETETLPAIPGIDNEACIKNCGSARLGRKLWKDYASVVDFKSFLITDLLRSRRINDYRVEVHALKSSSNLIGAVSLAGKFEQLEKYAKEFNLDKLNELQEGVILEFKAIKEEIEKYKNMESTVFKIPNKGLIRILERIIEDAEDMYIDGVDSNFGELCRCVLPENVKEDYLELKYFIADVNFTKMIQCSKRMIEKL